MSTTSHIPANEPERLTALAPYRVLGTSPDAVFDEIVRLTAKLFNVPIALIALVDEASVWFKANFGMIGTEQIARDESVCSIAIRNEDTTIFNDLRETPCALAKPHVAESLQLRFYAGHPLRNTQGYNIGALCVIDRKPRQLSTEEQKRLQELAGIVMKMLDLRLALMRRPELASTAWIMLYDKLDTSLNRG
jgi:GAF domain-containing protein